MSRSNDPPILEWTREGDCPVLVVSGTWNRTGPVCEIRGEAPDQPPARYRCDDLGEFDSTLPATMLALIRQTTGGAAVGRPKPESKSKPDPDEDAAGVTLDGLPDDLRGLMELALGVAERSDAKSLVARRRSLGQFLGQTSQRVGAALLGVIEFVGLSVQSLGRLLVGRARFRRADLWLTIQECGVQALPIVSLISFLIGVILAFVGGYQLAGFGAEIFVADLVGIAMVREMGVVMTGIIMSGRTGAAFAAHIGSMKANEEIDALRTFGLNPFDFLVLPRLLALVLMMPLLTVYANLVGILGGMLVGVASGIPAVLYWQQTLTAIDLTTASLGVFKSVFFGAAIAICGCMQGMKAASSSAGVGQATTRAVVASITMVIVLDSAFAAIFTVLDI